VLILLLKIAAFKKFIFGLRFDLHQILHDLSVQKIINLIYINSLYELLLICGYFAVILRLFCGYFAGD